MRKLLFVLSLSLGISVSAQQDPQYTHFMFDRLSINPGFAGTQDAYCVTGILRNQWNSLDAGEPQTKLLNFHAPVEKIKGGLGINVINDQIGQFKNNHIKLNYSYHAGKLGPGNLAVGVGVGYFTSKITPSWITPDVPAANDAAISNSTSASNVLDFSFGGYYYTDNYYAGISSTHLTESKFDNLNVVANRHYYLTGGYKYDLNANFELKPNVLVKTDLVSTQFDVNMLVKYKQTLWAGLTYRHKDAIAPMVGYQKPFGNGTVKIGYSYDRTTSAINNYSTGTHELMLNYCFNIIPKIEFERAVHPRFL